MQRFLVVLVAAAVVSVGYAAAAPGGQKVAPPTAKQFKALKRQVAGLGTKLRAQGAELTTLQGTITTLQGTVNAQSSTITTLQNSLSSLQTDESQVKAVVNDDDAFITNCLLSAGVLGVDQLGSSFGPDQGYVFQQPGGGGTILTTALDLDTGDFPGAWFQIVQPDCVDTSSTVSHLGGALTEHPASALVPRSR